MFTNKTDITAQDVKQLLLRVYKQFKAGEITEQRAYKETSILSSILKAIEITDIDKRLQQIEGAIRDAK